MSRPSEPVASVAPVATDATDAPDPPVLLHAMAHARTAATCFTMAWAAFMFLWLLFPIGFWIFSRTLKESDVGISAGILGLLATATLPLVLFADAFQAYALAKFARTAGHPAGHPLVWVVVSLTLPFIATAATVSAANTASSSHDLRLPANARQSRPFPTTSLALWIPLGALFASSLIGFALGALIVGGAGAGASPVVVLFATTAEAAAYGAARIVLGLRLRTAFDEMMLRPRVDAMRTAGVEPVAGN